MGIRFRKKIKIAPGVNINLNSKSVSVTTGVKGAHHTVSSNGSRTTSVGIPGTGLSYAKTTRSSGETQKSRSNNADVNNKWKRPYDKKTPQKRWYQSNFWIILFLIVFFPVGLYLMWRYAKWNKAVKVIVTVLIAYAVMQSVFDTETETQKSPEITAESTLDVTVTPTIEPTLTPIPTKEPTSTPIVSSEKTDYTVWISGTGSKYHSNSNCSNMSSPTEISLSDAKAMGYEPCDKCY